MLFNKLVTAISSLTLLGSVAATEELAERRERQVPALAPVPSFKTPSLSFLYTLNCTLGNSLSVGNVPNGNRVVIPITGGVFAGPKVSGKVLNLGADWGLIDNNGTFSADTRYHLVTDDGTSIFIRTSGPAQKNGNIHLRLQYETSTVGKYSWLNDVIAVGILKAGNGYVVIDAYELTSLA